jgi:ATP-dependent RNA helicase RhlE
MKFNSFNLSDPILRAVMSEGYETPTPIQVQAIPLVLERKDVLACAQTGTGKTAAFALPILQLLSEPKAPIQGQRPIRVLVLTPTRELASQISKNFSDYGKELPLRNAVIFGGVNQKSQVKVLRQGLDILIATPGRLLDLMQQRHVQFQGLEILVLDEADRMLDMGFIRDVKRVISALPKKRQTLFFSATISPEIRKLSEQILFKPVRIEVTAASSTAEKIDQSVYYVEKKKKTSLLIRLLEELNVERGLVFARTKRDANRVSEELNRAGIRSNAIHGNKSQNAREQALASIKKGECRVLVATDIAARGIDIDRVTHVFNHDIPNVAESYVHRIGRTARAGCEGNAYSFCSNEERDYLSDIEKLIRQKIAVLSTPEDLALESGGSKSVLRPPRGRPKKSERLRQRSELSNSAPKIVQRPHLFSSQSSGHKVLPKPLSSPLQRSEGQNKPIHKPVPSTHPTGLSRRERRLELQLKWQQSQIPKGFEI